MIDSTLAGQVLAARRLTDTFTCANPACGKQFVARKLVTKKTGSAYATRRRFCSEACNQAARGPRKPKGERVSGNGQNP